MSVNELIKKLENLRESGYGECEVQIYDYDSDDWEAISCFTYGTTHEPIQLYSDDLD